MGKKEAMLLFTDKDIATIEAMHDMLLDNGHKLNDRALKESRDLTGRMYKALKYSQDAWSGITKTEIDKSKFEEKLESEMKKFADLPQEKIDEFYDEARILLDDLWWCGRAWSGWDSKTMSQADFVYASDDDEIVGNVAEKLYSQRQKQPL